MSTPIIRPVQKKDNPQIANVIRSVLTDFNIPKEGTAFADKALDTMYETYHNDKASYFILEENGKIIGGGGVAPLDNYEGNVCELQKMYFLPEARGRGLGTRMLDMCLDEARRLGYEQCYLETMPHMESAQKLYKRYGFQYLEGRMGDTGHYACGVHMIKTL